MMPLRLAVRARSRRAFSASDSCSSSGISTFESTSNRVCFDAMSYSQRSSWNWSVSLPRRKVTRLPSGDTFRFCGVFPASAGASKRRSIVNSSACRFVIGHTIAQASTAAVNTLRIGSLPRDGVF